MGLLAVMGPSRNEKIFFEDLFLPKYFCTIPFSSQSSSIFFSRVGKSSLVSTGSKKVWSFKSPEDFFVMLKQFYISSCKISRRTTEFSSKKPEFQIFPQKHPLPHREFLFVVVLPRRASQISFPRHLLHPWKYPG